MISLIWSMEAKISKCETEIQAKIGSKKPKTRHEKLDNTNICNFVTE